jgi:Uma2 family endonuclease
MLSNHYETAKSILTPQLPLRGIMAGFRQFTVDEYEQLVSIGIITENDNLELLEGYLVNKMGHNPPHDGSIQLVEGAILDSNLAGLCTRVQYVIRASTSETEPDNVIVRGNRRSYLLRHPHPADIGLVIEVADSTLDSDRTDKVRIYARDGLPTYWIVNLVDRQIEAYTVPQPTASPPSYATRIEYLPGQSVPMVLDGQMFGSILIGELLP